MSMQALRRLNEELFRLAMAGSGLAAGDIRLDEPVRRLKISGQTVPVFRRAAELAEALQASGSPQALMDAAALCQAVLSSQTAPLPELPVSSPLPQAGVEAENSLTYRDLVQIREALTGRSSGRTAVLTAFAQSGTRPDVRLLPALLDALGDSCHEIPELAAALLKPLGRPLLPFLQERLDLKRAALLDVRLLRLIAELSGPESLPLCRDALAGGGKSVRIEALSLLSRYGGEEDLALLTAALEDKSKDVRDAALAAVGTHPSAQGEALLLSMGRRASDDPGGAAKVQRLIHITEALGFRGRIGADTADWLKGLLQDALAASRKDGVSLRLEAAILQALASQADLPLLEYLEGFLSKCTKPGIIISRALKIRDAASFYKLYACLGKAEAAELRRLMMNALTSEDAPLLDPRWNDHFIDLDDGLMTALTARPGMRRAETYMRKFRFCKPFSQAENLYTVYCAYPRALLRMGITDFWPELANALTVFLDTGKDEIQYWRFQETFFIQTFRMGGDYMKNRVEAMSVKHSELIPLCLALRDGGQTE